MGILVSINCITYNHEACIADAIEGFLMQKTDFEYEILIGEDCSTDNTREMIEGYIKKYPGKIRLITSESNVGWRANEMRLLENSRGKYIAICEGDDYWVEANKLQKQVDYMESHPECSLCFHAADVVNNQGYTSGKQVKPYNESRIASMRDMIVIGDFSPTASYLFPKKYVENLPLFYQNAHVGDYPMQMWLSSEGYAYYIDEVMSAYRTGVPGSWTSKINSGNPLKVIEKYIRHKEQDMELLDKFNEYHNYKFSDEVETAKVKREFEILLLQNNILRVKSKKFKPLYDELGLVEKAKLYTKYFFPNISTKLLELKRGIR